jgi:TonB family protein
MSVFRLLPVVVALGLACSPGLLLAQANSGKDAKSLSDSDRAKRDADKVFSFIKFHTVRTAPAPAKPTAQAAPPTRSLGVAAAPASQPVAATPASVGAAATSSAAAPAAATPSTLAADAASSAEPAVTTADLPADAASAAATLSQAPLQAAPQVEEEEEVPLRLVDYVAPDMSAQVLAAMPSNEVTVPVRFTVQPDGRVSSAQAMGGSAPRRVAQAAVRAVQQWRFDPLPAERTVDVEINFKAE